MFSSRNVVSQNKLWPASNTTNSNSYIHPKHLREIQGGHTVERKPQNNIKRKRAAYQDDEDDGEEADREDQPPQKSNVNSFAATLVSREKPKNNIKRRKRILEEMQKESLKISKVLGSGELVNCYKVIDKKYLGDENAKKYAAYKDIQIDLPFQSLVVGATGSGKTNFIRNLLTAIGFTKILLCAKNTEEPIYADLIDRYKKLEKELGEQCIWIYNDPSELPDVSEIGGMIKNQKAAFIFDDFVTSKDQEKVKEYYSQGRKCGDGGVSCFYLAQSYYDIPNFNRKNARQLFLGLLTTTKDLGRVVSEYSLDVTAKGLTEMYNDVQDHGRMNFLTIDLTKTPESGLKYRRNLDTKNSIPLSRYVDL